MARGRPWAHDELVVAMNLYCTMEFGQFHARNRVIIEIAGKLDRSPSSLAMKLCNFASLDPFHAARGVSGLSGASQADREVWAEFHRDWEGNAFESERLLAKIKGKAIEQEADIDETDLPREGKERERVVRQRVNQHFFRSAILAAYDCKCCVTGLANAELLVASHIIPWGVNKEARVNPRNGLCLNALHDRAFDRGLMTVSKDYRVKLASQLKVTRTVSTTQRWIAEFDGCPIRLPQRFQPDEQFLDWHRRNVFRAS